MKAEESDWKLISDIYASCTEWLLKQGMRHWENVSYRNSQEKLMQRIRENDVYILFFDEKAVGTIPLSYQAPSYLKGYSFWEDSSASAVYVSKLAVLPDYHERGFGSELLQFAEDEARHKGINYVRFDAIASYKKLDDFYRKRGYKIVGKGVFGNVEGNFFEKSLGMK